MDKIIRICLCFEYVKSKKKVLKTREKNDKTSMYTYVDKKSDHLYFIVPCTTVSIQEMKRRVLERSLAQGLSESRLPEFTDQEKQIINGMFIPSSSTRSELYTAIAHQQINSTIIMTGIYK